MQASPRPASPAQPPADAVQAAYVAACVGHAHAERERLHDEINTRQTQVARLSQELRAASRALHQARARLKGAEAVLASERARLERDFADLRALPSVRSVEVDGTRIRVRTEPIVIQHADRRYRMGEFALDLDLEHGIQVRNLHNAGQKRGWDHPHVQVGQPCLGNLRDGFEKLLAECQLVPLVAMLLQFLETYTPETAYGPIELWPLVDAAS
jgi:hypothetical protein